MQSMYDAKYDANYIRELLLQIENALQRVTRRFSKIETPDDFICSEEGEDMLDSIAMMLLAVGENIKKIDYQTSGKFLKRYSEADWKGAKGLRDIISHQYFDLNEEQIFSVCTDDIPGLLSVVRQMIKDCEAEISAR